jgi:hypothetical protein
MKRCVQNLQMISPLPSLFRGDGGLLRLTYSCRPGWSWARLDLGLAGPGNEIEYEFLEAQTPGRLEFNFPRCNH